MSPEYRRRRQGSWKRRLMRRLRSPGSPSRWLIVPLLIVGVLVLGWIVSTLATTDVSALARGLVKMRF